jgi:glycosyltransferase involved in cell wall biosynthesis
MKIGVFTYGIEGERMTGIARYTVELTRALRRLDPTLEIVLLNPYPGDPHPWYREFPTHPLPSLRRLPLAATLGNWQLHRAARALAVDVLHDPCGIAPFAVPRGMARYARVTTVHDAIPLVYPRTQPLLTRLVFHTLVRASGRTADAILTMSEASRRDLVRTLGLPDEKLHVTLLAANDPPAPLPTEVADEIVARRGAARPYFLYVGALHPRKNLPRVLEAFARVRREAPEATLVIVGPPSWGASDVLRRVLERTGDGVTFTGFISDADLRALYERAHALVFPSLYEGFGLPPLEAMAVGTPVLTSNVSSLPEVVGDAALQVDPTSVDAIADAMARLLRDDDLRADLAQRGRERSRAFSWEATARATLSVYRAAVRHRVLGPSQAPQGPRGSDQEA